MKNELRFFVTSGLLSLAAMTMYSEDVNRLVVNSEVKGAEIPSTMYGVFFEDINYGADGGLYAEKIKNRSFEFPQALMGWTTFGKVKVKDDGPFERNPHYVVLSDPGHPEKRTGLMNEGFFGVSFEKGEEYRFSVWARCETDHGSKITVELIDPSSQGESQVMASVDVEIEGSDWRKYVAILSPSETVKDGRLRIFLNSKSAVDLEHVSLFPVETWMGHENGLRKDLVEKLHALKPGVFRFPGGCIVEGTDLDTRYQWKNTVGPVENRPLNENRWHYTFPHKFFPDYFQSYGLGFFEYFQLAEELGSEPLPVLNVGLICQYQNWDENVQPHVDELEPYIQDALDLIEFANGDTLTEWGGLRASMGHKEPFDLKFIAIGNEQWDEIYPQHLEPFVKAIRSRYPEIKIIGSSGPQSEGEDFEYLWPEMKRLKVDLVDEHFYRPEKWFLSQGGRYDSYDRDGPKVFAGEYACHGSGKKYNHFNASLMEAAFMTGLERNADVVEMATYAPLFAHVEGWQWRPDLIWFDNLQSYPTSSYYVQQLYSTNKGTNVVPVTMNGSWVKGDEDQNGLFASGVYDSNDGSYIVKVVNTGKTSQQLEIELKGLNDLEYCETIILESFDGGDAENSLSNPSKIIPMKGILPTYGNHVNAEIPAESMMVFRVAEKK